MTRHEWIKKYEKDSKRFHSLKSFARLKIVDAFRLEKIRKEQAHDYRYENEESKGDSENDDIPIDYKYQTARFSVISMQSLIRLFASHLQMPARKHFITDNTIRAAMSVDLLMKVSAVFFLFHSFFRF